VSEVLAKLSTIDIAKKQRHMFLLRKVQENRTLSRAELDELKRYERQAAGKITAKARMTSKVRPKKKKRKAAATTKRIKKKAKKKRKARPPVDEAEVRRLGLECENLTEADAAIRTRRSLAEIFRKHPQLRQAWDRGRFLRNLRGLARTGASVSEAAKKLGFAKGRVLRTMIDEDAEVGDLWDQTQLEVYIEIKSALVNEAKEGNQAAIKAVENFLLDEKEQPGLDPSHVTILQLTELMGKHRITIHRWHTKNGLPRNADKTFDLGIFLAWYEEYLLKKVSAGKAPVATLDPLRAAKAEMIKLELAKRRKQLLDRQEVVVGLVQRIQHLKDFCARGAEELSWRCRNQPREKIKEIFDAWFRKMYLSFTKLPNCLELPPEMEKELVDFLQRLNPQGDGGETNPGPG